MSLPSGYTELYYILNAGGTQYIDTGLAPSAVTKLGASVQDAGGNNATIATIFRTSGGERFVPLCYYADTAAQAGIAAIMFGTWVRTGVATSASSFLCAESTITLGGQTVLTVNGTSYTIASTPTASQAGGNIRLFTDDDWNRSIKIAYAKMWNGNSLVRHFVPAKRNSDGAVGLYDLVNSQFFGNAGAGSFTAGPEVPQVPEAPKSFTAEKNDDTHFTLSWSAVEDASGYKVYRYGALAATQTATSYTAAVTPFQSVTFAVTAYNDDGESDPATLTVKNIPDDLMSRLITDRTQADVDALNALLAKPMSQWTAAEKAALLGGMKGGYFAADLNRVGAAVDYLAEKLHGLGYAVSVSAKQDWSNSNDATDEDMEVYRDNVAALRAVLAVFSTTPDTPEDLVKLTWREANDIEQVLVDVDRLITNLERSWYYSGEVYAGDI